MPCCALILEAGAYELVHRPDIPPRVTISEYVADRPRLLQRQEPGLANGVFDRLGAHPARRRRL